MPADMFLKVDGIDGESVDDDHKNEIEVLSFSFGLQQMGSSGAGTGAGTSKVNVNDFVLTKYVDKSSVNLMKYCSNGKHIPSIVFVARKAAGDSKLEYLKYTMTDSIISSVSIGASGGGDELPTENVSINFGKIEWVYNPQTAQGGGGGEIIGSVDQKTGKVS